MVVKSKCDWPMPKEVKTKEESLVEVGKTVLANTQVVDKDCVIKFGKFSNLERLIKVMAIVGRFVDIFKARVKHGRKRTETLEVSGLIMAERALIRIVQKELMERSDYEKLVRQLKIVERDGIVRCKGRLGHSDLELEVREPILLPKDHHLTKLILKIATRRFIIVA